MKAHTEDSVQPQVIVGFVVTLEDILESDQLSKAIPKKRLYSYFHITLLVIQGDECIQKSIVGCVLV